jgi:hypothetical protein
MPAALYRRGTPSSLPGSDRLYLDRELGKLERVSASIAAALPDTNTKTKAELLALTGVATWQIAFISDPTANKNMVFYDGAAWRYPDGNAV